MVKGEQGETPVVKGEQGETPVVKGEQGETSVVADTMEGSKPVFTVNIGTLECRRIMEGVPDEVVQLSQGEDGLLVAEFGDGSKHTTELSNLMLQIANRKIEPPKKKEVRKRPAAVMKKPSSAEPELEGDAAVNYYIMWYKRDHTVAVREKGGQHRQVISIGGRSCAKTQEELEKIGKDAIEDLDRGMSVADAKRKGRVAAGLE